LSHDVRHGRVSSPDQNNAKSAARPLFGADNVNATSQPPMSETEAARDEAVPTAKRRHRPPLPTAPPPATRFQNRFIIVIFIGFPPIRTSSMFRCQEWGVDPIDHYGLIGPVRNQPEAETPFLNLSALGVAKHLFAALVGIAGERAKNLHEDPALPAG
jgi:hypothetical protein